MGTRQDFGICVARIGASMIALFLRVVAVFMACIHFEVVSAQPLLRRAGPLLWAMFRRWREYSSYGFEGVDSRELLTGQGSFEPAMH